jgi:hypothetical protein
MEVLKTNLKEAMQLFAEHLDERFLQEGYKGYRASLDDDLDLAVFCLSQFGQEDSNREYKYVIQTLAKNNTIKSQTCFDDVWDAIEILNKQIA